MKIFMFFTLVLVGSLAVADDVRYADDPAVYRAGGMPTLKDPVVRSGKVVKADDGQVVVIPTNQSVAVVEAQFVAQPAATPRTGLLGRKKRGGPVVSDRRDNQENTYSSGSQMGTGVNQEYSISANTYGSGEYGELTAEDRRAINEAHRREMDMRRQAMYERQLAHDQAEREKREAHRRQRDWAEYGRRVADDIRRHR